MKAEKVFLTLLMLNCSELLPELRSLAPAPVCAAATSSFCVDSICPLRHLTSGVSSTDAGPKPGRVPLRSGLDGAGPAEVDEWEVEAAAAAAACTSISVFDGDDASDDGDECEVAVLAGQRCGVAAYRFI